MVGDDAARAAGEDRRDDRPPRPIDQLPDGRGHSAARVVSANHRRPRDTASDDAGPMLRTLATRGQPGCRQETRVGKQGFGSRKPPYFGYLRTVAGVLAGLGPANSLSQD